MLTYALTQASRLREPILRLDPEFFRPERIEAGDRLRSMRSKVKLGHITSRITQGPNPIFSDEGVRCLNGKNIYFGTASEGEPNYISEREFDRYRHLGLQQGDIVITLKHATKVGRAWIVEDPRPCLFSRNVGLIRQSPSSPISTPSLLFYLWASDTQLVIDRFATGGTSGQITLPMAYLRNLWVPIFSPEQQTFFDGTYEEFRSTRERSASLFASAQALLESELGLDKLVFEKPVSYTARFSEVSLSQAVEGNRIDAQCFSTSALFYEKILDRLPRTEKLLHLTDALIKGSQQVESPKGDVPYVSIKHIQKNEVVAEGSCRSYPGMPEAQRGDLLLAITGATIGKVGVVHRYDRLAFSGDLLAIRAREDIDPYYLQAFLTHRIGQVQLIRWITGSTNGHLAPRDVGRVVIPRLPEKLEAKIAEKTRESIEKFQESERLLDQAKRRVEELIEEAIER